MIKLIEKRPVLTIIIVVGVLLLPFLDVLEVTIMEARNFVTAREMLTDGNWILTTMNGEPRYEKPPLPTWLSAISGAIFGVNSVWAMRFPAVLMVMLLGSMIYTLSRKLTLTKRNSLINALVSITSLYVILIVFEAPWDIYAHAFMLTAIYCIFKGLSEDTSRGNISTWLIAAICIGASILSKGPVSLYVLFLPFLIAYVVIYRRETERRKWLPVTLVLLGGLLLGFSWYGYVRAIDPETFAAIASKETGNWTSYNVRPFYYYWSFFVQSGLWTIPAFISLLYPYLKTRVSNRKAYRFTFLWTIIAVVLLSVIPEKKSRYLMPVLIPLAMNVGFYITYLVKRFKELKSRKEIVPVYFNVGLLLLIFIAAPIAFIYLAISHSIAVNAIGVIAFMVVLIVALYIIRALMRGNIYHVFLLIVLAVICTAIGSLSVLKNNLFNEYYSAFIDEVLESSTPLYSFEMGAPEVFWGAERKIVMLDSEEPVLVDERFYLLLCSDCETVLAEKFNGYQATYIQDFDFNYNASGSRAYKGRKSGKVYEMIKVGK
ncbi:4-amino-4-deoxy-L-arabinose transferase-like glycosyltransferase [Dokdonia sp. Hel_I_63]|uniref:ArnT family glycosyltransferase n=1 Tax=unclassified Dokdonia TaxID=2615033 RepID=UPI00020A667F|nr:MULTISPECIES: glycosyltransferase family 39 protein [unclassified Dokdonia]AEE19515.1 glycosyl transferase family 39 [Dokdonia sp. 4H-3-7-5]TVZ21257.1 4-amino-4-deoxy-L-arabinose transferase-like glycosyltransferase [Dokdonia sp. Hel_I_63]